MQRIIFLLLPILITGTLCAQESKSDSSISYLALGDSYTIGESVVEEGQWPRQLRDSLAKKEVFLDEPVIIAKTGWRTDEMLKAARKALNDQQFDLVSLLIGVNNEYQGKSPASFEKEFENCLKYAIEHCKNGKKGVFVLSIPDYGYTPFGEEKQQRISRRIDKYNTICKEICSEYGVLYLNITDISRRVPEDLSLVAEDNLHPSAAQYARWIERIAPEVYKLTVN